MEPRTSRSSRAGIESLIGLGSCAAVALGAVIQRLAPDDPEAAKTFATPEWLPFVAAVVAAAAIVPLDGPRRWRRLRPALCWTGLLLMVWLANGLPFDLLTAAGLIGHRAASGEIVMSTVYLPGLVTRAFALVAVVVLARLAFTPSDAPTPARRASWYGYAAFLLALPYPILRLYWALGGTLGLKSTGAAGEGFAPLLIAIPWVLAAVLSLFLVRPPQWLPRRLLLVAGWSATAIVATIGPSAIWAFVSMLLGGGEMNTGDIEVWVFGLFYGSWFLWVIAGGAATRSYQLRTATPPTASPA